MKKALTASYLILFSLCANAQGYYFPPTTGSNWDTVSPSSLGWCTGKLDTIYKYLEAKHTKGFMVLKGGRIVLEKYFDGFTKDSIWYWASAGKTITSFLTGIAQQEGKLDISDKTSQYLGSGWTQVPQSKEDLITIRHQLTMSSGLDDGLPPTGQIPDPDNCLEPQCLQYKADAGTRWAYHNAPYRLLQDVIDSATGLSINQYTNQKLKPATGIQGLWFDYVYYSRVRDMARFGSLIINKGKWGSTALMTDTAYFNAMVNTSQGINPSYGYLWWLNGKGSYRLPGLQTTFNTDLIPTAPDDLIAALGKNDQKLYIIPGMDMVMVRMGNSAGNTLLALSSFDTELWGLLMQLFCNNNSILPVVGNTPALYPNPVLTTLYIDVSANAEIEIIDMAGRVVKKTPCIQNEGVDVSGLSKGIYLTRIYTDDTFFTQRFVKE
jgi:CubicO group peptidase (beta-lactamase class C family)